jgi:hypothetical protein
MDVGRVGNKDEVGVAQTNWVACFSLRQEPVAVPQSALCFVDAPSLPRNLHAVSAIAMRELRDIQK